MLIAKGLRCATMAGFSFFPLYQMLLCTGKKQYKKNVSPRYHNNTFTTFNFNSILHLPRVTIYSIICTANNYMKYVKHLTLL